VINYENITIKLSIKIMIKRYERLVQIPFYLTPESNTRLLPYRLGWRWTSNIKDEASGKFAKTQAWSLS
jgi:hypothetical protein